MGYGVFPADSSALPLKGEGTRQGAQFEADRPQCTASSTGEQIGKSSIRRHSMKTRYKRTLAILSAISVVAVLVAIVGERVKAAGEGTITGSVKLNGTAPHMKGIDMSKDPYCVAQHKDNPAKLENVVVGANGGLQNVVLYLSEGLAAGAASAVPSQEPAFDQKGCMYTPHVLAMDTEQKFKVTTCGVYM